MYPGSDDAGDATGGQAKFEFLTLKARSSAQGRTPPIDAARKRSFAIGPAHGTSRRYRVTAFAAIGRTSAASSSSIERPRVSMPMNIKPTTASRYQLAK